MDPTLQAVFFLVAVVLLSIDAFVHRSLMAFGLAFFVAVFAWNALAAL